MYKLVTWGHKLWPQKWKMKEHFESVSFEIVWFCHKLYIRLPGCPKPSASTDFFKCCFDNLCFQLMQNVIWTNEIMCMVRHKWGKIGPSYLLSEHGDPPFYIIFGVSLVHFYYHFFIITTTKFEKNECVGFYFRGITLKLCFE